MTHPFFDHAGPLPLAHQGGGGENVENSTAAFAHAAALGYRYLDVDLQLTSDGVLLAHHDEDLDRLTDLTGPISDKTWDEVSEARLPNGEPLARFEDLLDTHADARWNIEVKTTAGIEPATQLIRDRAMTDRVCLNSFRDLRVRRMRRALADLDPCTSTGAVATLYLKFTSYVPLPYLRRWDATQAPIKDQGIRVLDERFVRRAHRVGLKVVAWTINEEAEMKHLLDMGLDGILTDEPTLLRSVLQERGQWV